ncbi:hypothetical protein M1M96_01630 [Peptococcaceae bacterium]|nr:hypothetical protein [Peptococcaceae bacterium]
MTGRAISQTVMLKLRKALSGLKTILAQGKVTPIFRCLNCKYDRVFSKNPPAQAETSKT